MQLFITGGTGNIGSAVVAELLEHGHGATVLARSDASAALARDAGASVVRGGLADLAAIRAATEAADGAIHLAFGNDFSGPDALAANIAEETAAIETIAEALVGGDRPFAIVSGTPWEEGRPSVETDPLPTTGPVGGRGATVTRVLRDFAGRGVRTSAIRLPRTVHKDGGGGFAGLLTDQARRTGVSGYPGTGEQRWPAVHSLDAAVLFRLAIERAPAGSSWHAVQDEGDAVRDIAAVIGRRLGLPVQQLPDEAFGPLGPIFAADQPSSSAITRAELGWTPTHPTLLEDLERHLRP
ncbi:SDR family oxidoreductase [Amnibacterium kyonggiense]|uniref:Nucleoside-diphosphate-sugar epimerase n=1 Tax=Amnibacterium kyonggiense TaxID=595671 RepID=A0A4R7FS71_9MICO|nr:SDR family oxidoreductase [Amnibacterium kyonggiense]TDS80705.1 nucleoside-diphosphate-sugar epimerase [Amnibacterium kyonggiense]